VPPASRDQSPPADDAVLAAAEYHRILIENDVVRVLETRIAPGETVPLHSHRWPSVQHFTSGTHLVRRGPDGEVLLDTRAPDAPFRLPTVIWVEPQGPHSVENVGDTEIHFIGVELKRAGG
jgi:quercetin dioxygenase-like cupin family protein